MAEMFHDDALANVKAERDRLNTVIDEINWLRHYGDEAKPTAKTARVGAITTKAPTLTAGYKGNARPVPVEP